jgi:hypothetical protein
MSDHSPTSDCVDYTRVMRYGSRLHWIMAGIVWAVTIGLLL